MSSSLKELLQETIQESLKEFFVNAPQVPSIEVETPNDKNHGDFSTNIALKSAKWVRKPPMAIAGEFCDAINARIAAGPLCRKIAKVEVKKPGFINFYMSLEAVLDILRDVFEQGDDFGRSDLGRGEKILLEFVSANPTGPLSVAHARQAVVGDALGNILRCIGFDVQKEFYVNDEGNQINLLGRSIYCRGKEIFGQAIDFPEGGYQGEYICDMAQDFIKEHRIKDAGQLDAVAPEVYSQYGVKTLMDVIHKELEDFGVHFDVWSHQSQVASEKAIRSVLEYLEGQGHLYEQDGALWFKSTSLGDDKDRVVRKSDESYTYLAPDIAYHKDKYQRGYRHLINIWGPDHHGYIPRIKAAVQALGFDAESLKVLIVQLATIYREGQPVSMSTRRGQYISLREVMDEVGVDAARFFFLMRHINIHLDFDLELAKKETPENPVYYIQYAHARIHSIVKKAREVNINTKAKDFTLLREAEEIDLIKKVGEFPEILVMCRYQSDPFPLVDYLLGLAVAFHKFYDCHRVVDPDNVILSSERLSLIDAVRIVLANGLRLLGVSAPQRM